MLVLAVWATPVMNHVAESSSTAIVAATPQSKAAAEKKKQAEAKKKADAAKKAAAAKKKSEAAKKKQASQKKKPVSKPAAKADPKKQPQRVSLSAEQEAAAYQAKVAEVQRYNAKVAAYQMRDIEHRIGLWGQIGYSAIFPSKFTYNESSNPLLNANGFQSEAAGWLGGGAGLGYQMRYKRMLFTTGLEYQHYGSMTLIEPFARSFAMHPYETMRYTYAYDEVKDMWNAGYLQLPILFGMELPKWYWQAGAKLGLNVLGKSALQANLTTTIQDEELVDVLKDMFTHSLAANVPVAQEQKVHFGFNTALYAEIGLNLEQWITPKEKKNGSQRPTSGELFAQRLRYRIALFAEYGLLNINDSRNYAGHTNDVPADFTPVLGQSFSEAEDLYRKVDYASSLSTTAAQEARLAPFMVGVKASIFYALPRQKKRMKPIPKEPMPRMVLSVANEETMQAVSGAQLSIWRENAASPNSKTTNKEGLVVARLPKANYRIAASRPGFEPSDTVYATHKRDLRDTIRIFLKPVPQPIVPLLAGYVMAADSREPLEAEVTVAAANNTHQMLYGGETNSEGLFLTSLEAGTYQFALQTQGYMPLDTVISFTQDTLRFFLNPIKEGIRVRINNLYFATNKTIILPESEAALSDLAAFLLNNPSVSILITGHTDAIGSEEANMRLSIGRAQAVRNNLIQRGVDGERIAFQGKGETEPIADNDTEEGRAQNRRVEFEITGTEGEDIQQIR